MNFSHRFWSTGLQKNYREQRPCQGGYNKRAPKVAKEPELDGPNVPKHQLHVLSGPQVAVARHQGRGQKSFSSHQKFQSARNESSKCSSIGRICALWTKAFCVDCFGVQVCCSISCWFYEMFLHLFFCGLIKDVWLIESCDKYTFWRFSWVS